MPKSKTVFICSECGYETIKWMGKCSDCGAWNTLEESVTAQPVASAKINTTFGTTNFAQLTKINEIGTNDETRFCTGVSELDRVLGGGIVKGSLVLLGGDPGIGKSTLLLQICEYLGKGLTILYVSGEESMRQLKLRAIRLNVNSENLSILSCTDVEVICN
ncbi:MAG: ATPase domain-containing protein, partial [Oscillospiraceae bacterium]